MSWKTLFRTLFCWSLRAMRVESRQTTEEVRDIDGQWYCFHCIAACDENSYAGTGNEGMIEGYTHTHTNIQFDYGAVSFDRN